MNSLKKRKNKWVQGRVQLQRKRKSKSNCTELRLREQKKKKKKKKKKEEIKANYDEKGKVRNEVQAFILKIPTVTSVSFN